jgi:hypothetical protein
MKPSTTSNQFFKLWNLLTQQSSLARAGRTESISSPSQSYSFSQRECFITGPLTINNMETTKTFEPQPMFTDEEHEATFTLVEAMAIYHAGVTEGMSLMKELKVGQKEPFRDFIKPFIANRK